MRKMVLAAALLLVISALAANVVIPRAVERVWFDDSDNFWVRFGPEADAWEIGSLSFINSSGTYTFPSGYTLPPELPFELNFSQVIPGFSINRAEDFFRADTDPSGYDFLDEIVSWGPQTDTSVDIHPLTAGQSVVQYSVAYQIYMGEWESAHVWAKDNGTDYVNPYYPATLCTLSVQVYQIAGGPAPWVPIHLNYGTEPDTVWPDAQTNSLGWWQKQFFYAQRTRVIITDPIDGHWVYNQIHFPEPGEHIHIDATVWYSGVSPEDQVTGTLQLSPSILGTAPATPCTWNTDRISHCSIPRGWASTICGADGWPARICPERDTRTGICRSSPTAFTSSGSAVPGPI